MPRFVDKIRTRVRLAQPGKEPVNGFLSLAPQAPFHEGPETLLELLNSDIRVIPFIREDDDAVILLTRRNIDWVAAGSGVAPERIHPPAFRVTREERVELTLNNGSHVEGLVQMELPTDYNRISDFLNGAEDFYALVTRWGTVLINKAAVRETRLFESAPRPLGADASLY